MLTTTGFFVLAECVGSRHDGRGADRALTAEEVIGRGGLNNLALDVEHPNRRLRHPSMLARLPPRRLGGPKNRAREGRLVGSSDLVVVADRVHNLGALEVIGRHRRRRGERPPSLHQGGVAPSDATHKLFRDAVEVGLILRARLVRWAVLQIGLGARLMRPGTDELRLDPGLFQQLCEVVGGSADTCLQELDGR
jgi:hypothetical protein